MVLLKTRKQINLFCIHPSVCNHGNKKVTKNKKHLRRIQILNYCSLKAFYLEIHLNVRIHLRLEQKSQSIKQIQSNYSIRHFVLTILNTF